MILILKRKTKVVLEYVEYGQHVNRTLFKFIVRSFLVQGLIEK